MIDKIKNALINPKAEFEKIEKEAAPAMMTNFLSYSLILFLIPTICTIVGWSVIGYKISFMGFSQSFTSVEMGIKAGIIALVACSAAFFISTYVIDALAPSFKATKNIDRSAQLVAAVLTPGAIAGVFCLMPNLASLMVIGALYGGYILFVGLPILMKSPADQTPIYAIVAILIVICSFFIVSYILQSIIMGTGAGFGSGL